MTHEFEKSDNPDINGRTHPWNDMQGWNLAHKFLGVIVLIWDMYFILLETMKIRKSGLSIDFMGEVVFQFLTFALVIVNFAGARDSNFRIISIFILFTGYAHLILQLRLFESTAVLVSLLQQISKSIKVFFLVFLIAIIGIANMFFVMQGVSIEYGYAEDDATLVGYNFAQACVSVFQAAFGNFANSGNLYNYGQANWIVVGIYLYMAIMLQLVMLNMIIAIMGDTYDQVMQIQKEERLKAKCRLIS